MWDRSPDPEDERMIVRWMQDLAALPPEGPSALDPAQLWWKAELLRRWDAQRRVAAPIEVGERVQVGVGLAGAIALLFWLARQLPQATTSSTLTGVMIASVLLLVSVAAFSIWALISTD
jgi:hypothetical protein